MPNRKQYKDVACRFAGCDRAAVARGLCHKHYQAWRRFDGPIRCNVDGCDLGVAAHGMCMTHYVRVRRSGSTDDPVAARRAAVRAALAQN